jgi:hypothetical protein
MQSNKITLLKIVPAGGGSRNGLSFEIPQEILDSPEAVSRAFLNTEVFLIYLILKKKKLDDKKIIELMGGDMNKDLEKHLKQQESLTKIDLNVFADKPLIPVIALIKNDLHDSFSNYKLFMEEKNRLENQKPPLMYL